MRRREVSGEINACFFGSTMTCIPAWNIVYCIGNNFFKDPILYISDCLCAIGFVNPYPIGIDGRSDIKH